MLDFGTVTKTNFISVSIKKLTNLNEFKELMLDIPKWSREKLCLHAKYENTFVFRWSLVWIKDCKCLF